MIQSYRGTCDKLSSNPAEQNHSSIISHIGGALYEDPAFEIKLLLGRQREHEKKRNQEKAQYLFAIPSDILNCQELQDTPCLKEAKQKLDKNAFQQWKDEYNSSPDYTCQVCPETGSRTFINRLYPTSPRVLEAGARCSCRVCKQFLTQCRHEIAEQEAGEEFQLSLIDKRNHFFPTLHTKVKRCSNIEGADFKERSTTHSSSSTSVQFNAKADDGEMYVPAAATATSAASSSTAKRTSTVIRFGGSS